MADVESLEPGDALILPDGSVVTRRFDGGFRIRGPLADNDEPSTTGERSREDASTP